MFLSETSTRAELEIAAIFEANMDLDVIEAATDAELLAKLQAWIEEGDECGA